MWETRFGVGKSVGTIAGTMTQFILRLSVAIWLASCSMLLLVVAIAPQVSAGERVIFVAGTAGRRQLRYSDLSRGMSADLPPFAGNAFQPSVSPDQRELVFVADLDGDSELYLLPLGNGKPQQLTFNSHQDLHPQWSPDGNTIVYQANPDGVSRFFLIGPPDWLPIQLSFNDIAFARPSWSPDGKSLAYDAEGEIYQYDIESGRSYRLTVDGFWDAQPAWSPDGAIIVYESYRGGNWNLYKFELSSERISALTDPGRSEQHATFTNQPRKIVFQSLRSYPGRLILLDLDDPSHVRTAAIPPDHGSTLHLLFGNRDVLAPDWTDLLEPDWLR